MNYHTPYELIIAQKLQQLPVPDMADAIWARVERQLDIDMPTNDGGTTPPSPSGGGWIGGAALGIFVGALLLVFFLLRKEKDQGPQPAPVENTPAMQAPVEQVPESTAFAEPNRVVAPRMRGDDRPPDVISDSATALRDSLTIAPPVIQPDSSSTRVPEPSPTIQRAIQDSTKPKRRGVQGISDSDYRIVPKKKDSL